MIAVLVFAFWAAGSARAAAPTVMLTTGDGAKLSARYHPSTQPGDKSPAVLILDDLGEDARPTACDDLARQLTKDGCTVLCFDFRGTGKSRGVEPEFWDDPVNQKLVKGYKADELPEVIRHADFKPGYLPRLVNDVAAARAFLERRSDARDCNTAQIYVIGFGRGAGLGQLWLATEWARYRVTGAQAKVATRAEGREVAGCIWLPEYNSPRTSKGLHSRDFLLGHVDDALEIVVVRVFGLGRRRSMVASPDLVRCPREHSSRVSQSRACKLAVLVVVSEKPTPVRVNSARLFGTK